MVNVKVKICGITNLKDALHAVKMGSDALGFVFYKKSSRYITPPEAREIIKHLPAHVIKIGIFVNAREKIVKQIAQLCHLDMLQFHGNESPRFCDRFSGYKIIKAFRVNGRIDYAHIVKYKCFAFLFDTFVPSKIGGTGRKFDWRLISHINNIKRPIFLSGGLHIKNVKQAIGIAHPDWVDVSSSVELRPGKKDHSKVKKFIKAAKEV